jgi:hypothetical protein
MREIFVRRFICNGRMTGIGRVAKIKSVKILIAAKYELDIAAREMGGATYIH